MTDRTDSTRTRTDRPTTTPAPTRTPRPRRYPNNEENMNAPLVPLLDQPTQENDIEQIRRDLTALRLQLTRIERAMQTENQ
ncbi:hypothetical protein ACFQJC_04180 [Haloferax namakaokahaiae]|uniref:Uncharacterized protein n=1 Tax=Haloferax namakaokahaiae TaxID=1748331 RepID=A0ABD5ZC54_9EURY